MEVEMRGLEIKSWIETCVVEEDMVVYNGNVLEKLLNR